MDYYNGLNWTAYCFNTTVSLLKVYNYASGISSIVAFFLTFGILIVIIFYNSYNTILQRLVIYFTLSIMLFLAASATDLQLQFELHRYCRWTGYLKMVAHLIALLFSSEICAYLLFKMYHQLKYNKKLPHLNKWKSIVFELSLASATVLLPMLLLLLASGSLGVSSTVCWIQLFKSNSCTPLLNNTNHVIISLTVVKSIFYTFNFMSYSVLIGLFCWLACKSEVARKHYFSTARRTIILVFLMICTSGTDLIATFIFAFVTTKRAGVIKDNEVGVVLITSYYAAIQFVQPIAYLFYLNSIKKFHWDSTRTMARTWSRRGMNCCFNALKWLGNPFSSSMESDVLIPTQHNVNLNETPALSSSMSLYGSQNHGKT